MRYDVHKYLFMGASVDKRDFLHAAQKAGIIEFIDPEGRKKRPLPDDIDEMARAIKILRGYVQQPQDTKTEIDAAALIRDRILTLQEQLNSAEQTQNELEAEIERILPFGEFSPASLESFEKESSRKVRFFAAKSTKRLSEIEPALLLIKSDDGMDYFIAIQNEPIVFQDLIELHFSKPLSELQKLLVASTKEIDQIHEELKALTAHYTLLHKALIQRLNEAHLVFAEETTEFELENQLFVAEGWVPKTKESELQALCEKHNIYAEQVVVDKQEVPPTYLQNKGTAKVGEDLIRIFDTPSTQDKDPSLWVLFAFALFFSMIVYDAGYGLIFLATALILRFRLKKITSSTKRFIGLVAILATACILWGGLTHSFFGIHFEPDSPIKKHSLMTWLIKKKAAYSLKNRDETYTYYAERYPEIKKAKTPEEFIYASPQIAEKFTDSVLLELSLLLGATHIIIGLIRYLRKNPIGVGWIAFIIGCYLYIPYFLNATSIIHFVFGVNKDIGATIGLQLIAFGVGYAAVAGAVLHGVAGMFEFTHAIQIFADVLSYLRIYALGYAGFIVSETVNMLGGKLPLIFAIVVIVFGHVLNMTIAILGGTIHGLRLNFLEWYRYSFFGGGKDFRPLQLMTLEKE
ncbi:MAG: V-type ATP synthase subunit I [Verrucomicrobia bacterium]|nr:V-type ATP synthase subunit I [Verrucomicrobiota bacterium]MBS0636675.1 V-type ATP synthase subunit I [Verrucomicrobiota bacterium]